MTRWCREFPASQRIRWNDPFESLRRRGAAISDIHAALFIPQAEGEGLHARQERDRPHLEKPRLRLMTLLQKVIRNARTEMMYVVVADVAGKPLQDARQFIERAALQRSPRVVPVRGPFPVRAFELVLHVEQPKSHRACQGGHG